MSSPPQESQPIQGNDEQEQQAERENQAEQEDPLEDESENEQDEDTASNQTTPEAQEQQPSVAQEILAPVQVPDRYEMGKCTIHISITMLEGSNQPQDRTILLGIRNDADVPLIRMVRLADLEPLPAPLTTLLAQLESELPQRRQAMQEHLAKTQHEQATKAAAAKQQTKPRASSADTTAATQAIVPTTHNQPEENAVEGATRATPAGVSPQKQGTGSKRKAEDDSPFEQMKFF